MRKSILFNYQALLIFAFLGVLFVPFSFRNLDFQSKITAFLFEDLIHLITSNFKNFLVVNAEITSDSTTLYILFFILLLLAVIFTAVLSFFSFWKTNQDLIFRAIQIILTYYLAFIMLKYGFDKVFKVQFYLPEPNILYTPLGMLDKDILFWSSMGTSYSYNVFMGLMEVIPALLLLYNKTRILGLFILSGVLLNVVFINFGFDISVKLYSLFLLLICFLLLAPNLKKIIQFFIFNKPTASARLKGSDLITSKTIKWCIKTIVIFFFFTESLFPYLQKETYNNETIIQNPLHGAYEVVKIEKNETQKNNVNQKIKRIFVHRNNYFIFQYADDTMEDFYLEINPIQNQFILTDYNAEKIKLQYKYSKSSKTLELYSPELGIRIYSKTLPWKKLPLLQPLFHWTVDEIGKN
ncbi:hypothetical protein SAMN06265349_101270 [Flavobacterium resistens]|uniref:DoxX family protein n=1 Tax=Flavobacterium resistens TaxID=443612 RepID=A0A521ANK0_9FLAO|nr:hypothetical protein [Flavobacterium resistens]MRX69808.1 hypothetical protein [Flavobacterium resistens]SMO36387.1 hypothetical protein SAMN06265349_101270 [Flavobacterium resistens]